MIKIIGDFQIIKILIINNMSLILYAPKSHVNNGTKVDVVAKFLGIPLEYNRIPLSEWKSPEYLKKNPLGKVPTLETPEGCIYESLSIVRYLARKAGKMYGNNPFETAAIDQWLEFINTQLWAVQRPVQITLFGYAFLVPSKEQYLQARKELLEVLKIFDQGLKNKDFLATKEMSVVDVVLAVHLRYFFCLLLEEKLRAPLPNLTNWFVKMMAHPIFVQYYGKTWLCQKEFEPDFDFLLKKKKQIEDSKKQKPKKEEQKKEKPKKKKEEDQQQEQPKEQKKAVNPLDLLPKSPLVLDDFKRDFVNSEDLKEGMQRLWDKYDPEGWSLWKIHYVLYEGEGKVGYLTCNLKNGFIRNLDHFRKYSFGVIGVYGVEGDFVIEGAMMWRGTEIPLQWKEHNSYDYFEFTKLDHTNSGHKQLIEEYWTNIDGYGEGPVEGRPLWEAKWFK